MPRARQGIDTPVIGKCAGWMVVLATAAAVSAGLFQRGNVDPSVAGSASESPTSILEIFARNAFDWSSSTTPAPLSTTAVLVKSILADPSAIPAGLDPASVSVLFGNDDNNSDPEPADSSLENGRVLDVRIAADSSSEKTRRILDVRVAAVREWVSNGILTEVQRLCTSAQGCDPNERDPEFGTTPSHLAELWGSRELAAYLKSIGATGDLFDTVGRQPRNMTFGGFSMYSRMAGLSRLPAGADPEDRCEIPEVVIPLPLQREGGVGSVDASMMAASRRLAESPQTESEWLSSVTVALAEVRRLVSEGEPVVVRNALPWLLATRQNDSPIFEGGSGSQVEQLPGLKYPDSKSFVQAWSHRPVDVGTVPYAKNFALANEQTTLGEYVAAATDAAAAAAASRSDNAGRSSDGDTKFSADVHAPPNYVFQVDTEACGEGRELLGRVVDDALPSEGDKPLICPPPAGLRGMESVHYYLGGRGTGAPNHIHSDALNLAVTGSKKWWVVTPRAAVWSRRHIQEHADEHVRGVGSYGSDVVEEYRPMQFVQKAGDLVYVPADWGHAAMNTEDDTFGYTLELINRRDTLASVLEQGCEA